MSNLQLLAVVLGGTALIVGVAVTGFVKFSKFMAKERERTERFRDINSPR